MDQDAELGLGVEQARKAAGTGRQKARLTGRREDGRMFKKTTTRVVYHGSR